MEQTLEPSSTAIAAEPHVGEWSTRLRLQKADRNDVSTLRRLVNAAFAEHLPTGLNLTGIDQDEETTRIRMAGRTVWLAYDGRFLVATVSIENQAGPLGEGICNISQFAVHPRCKGRGVGSWLLRFAEDAAREEGAQETQLSAAADIPHVVNFYVKRGYAALERRRWPGKNYDSVILAKRL